MHDEAASTAEAVEAPSAPARSRSNIEVLIPTFNEELNIEHALRSVVEWADRVVVVDSESSDRTREIAEEMGAEVIVQPWLGYARQKNWALANGGFEADWTFILDADEQITEELRDELLAIAAKPSSEVEQAGFYINRLTFFMGKPIRYCGFFPSYNLRFFKRGSAEYEEREVHEHMVVNGPTARLRYMMLHNDRRGLEHFIAKHNRYSTLEARELVKEGRSKAKRATNLERGIALRRWLKHSVQPRLPLPGFWRFAYTYIVRLGFLDGINGLRFSLFLATYDFFIAIKLAELKGARADRPAEAPPDLVKGIKPKRPSEQPSRVADEPAPALQESPKTGPTDALANPQRTGDWRPLTLADKDTTPKAPISIVVLTYQEEINIRACLESIAWCDDVHVLDSGSSDRTAEIARKMGAQVHVNPFKSFGQQRNWAIDNISCKHRWHFHLDADERFTPALAEELNKRLTETEASDGSHAFRCPSMMVFMDQWLRHAAEYPVYQVRLFDSENCRFEDFGHGQREVCEGPIGTLENPYLHYNFSKGIEEWFDKHNRYSTLEATQARQQPSAGLMTQIRGVFSGDSTDKRRALKSLSYRVPMRSSLVLMYTMLFRRGFLDGKAGLNYARMRAIYEGMISVKLSVQKHRVSMGREESDEGHRA